MAVIKGRARENAGYHPGLRTTIVKGEIYPVPAELWSDEIFERVNALPAEARKPKGRS